MKNKLKIFNGLALVGIITLTMSISAFAAETDPYANNKNLQDTFKVYKEHTGNGLLLAPNPNATKAPTKNTTIDDILKVYKENEGNGLILCPNPTANQTPIAAKTNKGFLKSISTLFDFFSKISR